MKLTAKNKIQAKRARFKIPTPKTVQVEYYKELKKLEEMIKSDVNNILMPQLTADGITDIMNALSLLKNKYSNILAFGSSVANKIVTAIENYNASKFRNEAISKIGVDIEHIMSKNNLNEILSLQIANQTNLIKSIPAEFLKEIEQKITIGLSQGLTSKTIAKQIKGIEGITSTFGKLENRVKFIARNEVENVNATLNRIRQKEAGIDLYEWQTTGNKSVRDSHEPLDGKICSWDDPTIYADTIEDAKAGNWKQRSSIGAVELHPGMDYNCQCNALAILDIE